MSESTRDNGRRRFLKTAAAGGAATVALAAGGAVARDEEARAGAQGTAAPVTRQGYRVTPHVETYYRLARQ